VRLLKLIGTARALEELDAVDPVLTPPTYPRSPTAIEDELTDDDILIDAGQEDP
jgi:hypothetical protein